MYFQSAKHLILMVVGPPTGPTPTGSVKTPFPTLTLLSKSLQRRDVGCMHESDAGEGEAQGEACRRPRGFQAGTYPVKIPPSQSSRQPRPCRMLQWYWPTEQWQHVSGRLMKRRRARHVRCEV